MISIPTVVSIDSLSSKHTWCCPGRSVIYRLCHKSRWRNFRMAKSPGEIDEKRFSKRIFSAIFYQFRFCAAFFINSTVQLWHCMNWVRTPVFVPHINIYECVVVIFYNYLLSNISGSKQKKYRVPRAIERFEIWRKWWKRSHPNRAIIQRECKRKNTETHETHSQIHMNIKFQKRDTFISSNLSFYLEWETK